MKLISLEPQTLGVKAKQGTGKEGQLSDVGAGQLPAKEGSSHRTPVTGTEGQVKLSCLSHQHHWKTDPNLSAQRKLIISFFIFRILISHVWRSQNN